MGGLKKIPAWISSGIGSTSKADEWFKNYTPAEQEVFLSLKQSGHKPEDINHFLHSQFWPYEGMGIESLKPIQKIKKQVNEDLEMGDINLIGDQRVITADELLKPKVNVNISEAAKIRDRSSSQITNAINAHNKIYKPVLDLIQENPGMSLADAVRKINPGKKDNTISNIINRNFDRNVDNLKNLLPNDQFKNYENVLNQFKKERDIYKAESSTMPKSLESELTTYKSGEGIQQRDKYKSWFGEGVLQGEHTMMRPDKYKLVELGKKDVAVKFREPEYATTKTRNETIKNEISRAIKRHLAKRNDIIKEIQEAVKTKQSNSLPTLKNELQKIDDLITNQYNKAEKLGLELAIVNQNSGKINYYGKQYNNMTELYKSFKELNYNDGGVVRSKMSYGGDTSQYSSKDAEDYVQLAMLKGNPFKLKKPPEIVTDFDTNIKITDQGPGKTKIKETEQLKIGPADQKSIFYLKSDEVLANATQNKMQPSQWLGYLQKNGVSPTELDEFGLQNVIYNLGDYNPSTKKFNNNKAISKNDLITAYKKEKPQLTYKINQVEPFEKGLKDFRLFIGHSDKYSNQTDIEKIRSLKNKPADLGGNDLRVKLSAILDNSEYKSWDDMSKDIQFVINDTYKKYYGIDDVIKNGVGDEVVPFYSKNILDRFKRLKGGEGFYFSKNNVRHSGAQFLPGGTGYIEIPFTYNPQKGSKRASEPKYTHGDGHFTNPEGNNPVFWLRASERVDESGRRLLFIEEIQSDLHQGVKQNPKQYKYAARTDAPGQANLSVLNQQKAQLRDELTKVTDQIDKIANHTDPSAKTVLERLKVKRDAIRENLRGINEQLTAVSDTDGFPQAPFKKSENQAKVALKTAIKLAKEEGFDGVAIITGKAKNKGANASGKNAKGNLGFYDNIASKAAKNVAKNLGLDFSATNIKDGDGNTWAKIPLIELNKLAETKPTDMYKNTGGYVYYPSFVDVVPPL